MAKEGPGAEVIRGLLKKFPDTASRTLARKAYSGNKALWPNPTACLTQLRVIRGKAGDKKRKSVADKSQFRNKIERQDFPKLPDSLEGKDGWQVVEIDTPGPWGIISDIHLPFHNLPALRCALKEGKRRGWKGILINGDLFDFPQFSRFEKKKEDGQFAKDLYAGRQFLDAINDAFPRARKVFKFGNHDLHYSRWMWGKCPELLDVAETSLENLLDCDRFGFEVYNKNEPIKLGKLIVLHGHEFGQGSTTSPVSPAKTLHDRLKESGLCSHWHKKSNFESPQPVSEHVIGCYSIGCLCGLHPDWARLNQWGHGAATVDVSKDGAFETDNFKIVHGLKWR